MVNPVSNYALGSYTTCLIWTVGSVRSPHPGDAASEGARAKGALGFELHGYSDSVGPAGLKPAVPVESGHLSLTRGPFYYARGATTGLRGAVLLASIVFSFKKKSIHRFSQPDAGDHERTR